MSRGRGVLASIAALGLGAGLLVAGGGAASAEPGRVEARNGSPSSALAIVKTLRYSPNRSAAVAVNHEDDSVYVETAGSVSVVDGNSGLVAGQSGAFSILRGMAVQQRDDSVYIAETHGSNHRVRVLNGLTLNNDDSIPVGSTPVGVDLNQSDDTAYVANSAGNSVSVIDVATSSVSRTLTGLINAWAVAVDQSDDTIYVTLASQDKVAAIKGTNTDDSTQISVGASPKSVAVNNLDDTVYVANSTAGSISVIDGRTGIVDDTIHLSANPRNIAVDQVTDTVYATLVGGLVSVINGRNVDDSFTIAGSWPFSEMDGVAVDDTGTNQGLVYITGIPSLVVLAEVTPTLVTTSGAAGDEVAISVAAPQVSYALDDTTVASVSFGGATAGGLMSIGGNAWRVTAPSGSGSVPVTVTFNGGQTASAGTFSYSSSPAPDPVFPPSAPLEVSTVAGDASAVVSWQAPASAGSFPVSNYQAVVSPGGQSCLIAAPVLSCEISGLTNGTAYTAQVRALNGAGWGAYSTASAPFTPEPDVVASIVIAGSRGQVNGKPGIIVTGSTTGFGEGAILRPWIRFPGQSAYVEGSANILVDARGDFTWQRKTGKKAYVSVRSQDGSVVSNRIVIDAR